MNQNQTNPQNAPTQPVLDISNGVHDLAIAAGLAFALGDLASQLKRHVESVAADQAEEVKQ